MLVKAREHAAVCVCMRVHACVPVHVCVCVRVRAHLSRCCFFYAGSRD